MPKRRASRSPARIGRQRGTALRECATPRCPTIASGRCVECCSDPEAHPSTGQPCHADLLSRLLSLRQLRHHPTHLPASLPCMTIFSIADAPSATPMVDPLRTGVVSDPPRHLRQIQPRRSLRRQREQTCRCSSRVRRRLLGAPVSPRGRTHYPAMTISSWPGDLFAQAQLWSTRPASVRRMATGGSDTPRAR